MNAQLIKRSVVLCIVAAGIGGSGWWIFNGVMDGDSSDVATQQSDESDGESAIADGGEIAAPTGDDFDRLAVDSELCRTTDAD